ncbi:saccharopine dehydrogenase family protein [Halomarina oriensis]|uniref:Saccharopine dehydrogenase n=1 Tax=Halomarina oriensis TaxID=671145 RepID=A0A6B0GU39_9EURY|nr:saccharopine dehydrogenase NADP-binding domain-containing protein [Halomarina oriensis]MWG35228.1 saccharopine dehydrogenase [Halomarina oriensis]
MSTLLVYGSYGYTGELVVDRAVEELDDDTDLVLAGRSPSKLEAQADDHDLPSRAFTLDHQRVVERHLDDVDAVLNCAGPFSRTADALVDTCVNTGTDYLDITGEIEVFEALAARDPEAEEADVAVLPGVGFDVVPTDCLAAHLAEALPDATDLSLGFQAFGSFSRGTMRTAVESIGEGGAVRRDGRVTAVSSVHDTRDIDFGAGETLAVTVPWGDVSTAYRSTGVPNVQVYTAVPERAIRALEATDSLAPLLDREWVQRTLSAVVDRTVVGPDEDDREEGRALVWGEITDGEETFEARLETPETYTLTAMTAVEAARRTLDGETPTGYQTPSSAFGAEFVTEFEGVEREDATPVEE